LSEILKDNGYRTIGIDWLGRWHKKGFEYYLGNEEQRNRNPASIIRFVGKMINKLPESYSGRLRRIYGKIYRKKSNIVRYNARELVDKSIELIRSHNLDKPFFLFIHFWDTHTPYNAPKEIYEELRPQNGVQYLDSVLDTIGNELWKNTLRRMFAGLETVEEVVARYDAAIKYVDQEIGRLIEFLEDQGLFEETIFIITSDHGESLTEHGILFDHHGLYDVSIKVPLIMSNIPFPHAKRIKSLVQHIDIVPTVLDLLGIPYKEYDFDGMSLVPLMEEELSSLRSFIVAEEHYTQNKIAIRTDEWKYIYSPSESDAKCRYCSRIHGGVEELYHLESDPHENHNVVKAEPEIAERLKKQLFEFMTYLEHKKTKQEKTIISKKIRDLKLKGKI